MTRAPQAAARLPATRPEARRQPLRSSFGSARRQRRIALPDYIPDVTAGRRSPTKLSEWKIAAIKMAILLETRAVTRADFRALKMSPTRWLNPRDGWLRRTEAGGYVAGPRIPDFRSQHPVNYLQIRADAPRWMAAIEPPRATAATVTSN